MALFDFAFRDQAKKMKSEVDAVLQKEEEVWFRRNFGVYSIYCEVDDALHASNVLKKLQIAGVVPLTCLIADCDEFFVYPYDIA